MPQPIAQRALRTAFADLSAKLPTVTDSELVRFARDPFALLELDEEWTNAEGVDQVGAIFIPDVMTLQDVRLEPFEHQVEFTEAWIDLDTLADTGELRFRNVHIEKSRQMGMTWWLAYLVWWILNFHGVPGGYLSLDVEEVDDGGAASTDESFFGKVRRIHESCPPRLRPKLVFRGGNRPSIRNVARPGARVVGRGAVSSPGRGGAYLWWIWDEAARFQFGSAAMAALSSAVRQGLVMNSTPAGEGNEYFRIRDERPANFNFVRFHWSEHPEYGDGKHIAAVPPSRDDPNPRQPRQPTEEMQEAADACLLCEQTRAGVRWSADRPVSHRYPGKLTSPWYEIAILRLTDDQVAAELDIDYAGSLPGRVYTEFDQNVHVVDFIPYDPVANILLAWDYGLDVTAIAVFQETPHELLQIGELEVEDGTPDVIAPALVDYLADEIGVDREFLSKPWTRKMIGIGDPSADKRELGTGKPLAALYRQEGFNIIARPLPIVSTITAVKRMLRNEWPKRYRVCRQKCPLTISHWKLNRWPVDKEGNRKKGAREPDDDQHNHMMRAIAYFVSYRWGVPRDADEVGDAIARARDAAKEWRHTEARYGMKF